MLVKTWAVRTFAYKEGHVPLHMHMAAGAKKKPDRASRHTRQGISLSTRARGADK